MFQYWLKEVKGCRRPALTLGIEIKCCKCIYKYQGTGWSKSLSKKSFHNSRTFLVMSERLLIFLFCHVSKGEGENPWGNPDWFKKEVMDDMPGTNFFHMWFQIFKVLAKKMFAEASGGLVLDPFQMISTTWCGDKDAVSISFHFVATFGLTSISKNLKWAAL